MNKQVKTIKLTLLSALSCVALSACANSAAQEAGYEGIPDPLEKVNRTTLKINDAVDQVVFEPIARGYRKITPRGFRTITNNFLTNLKSPITIANQALQGDLQGTGDAVARMFINTLAGFGGILDLAEMGGIEHEPEDFGQTLAVWGVKDGAYLVLPLMGPSSVRDASGMMVDGYLDPVRTYLFNVDKKEIQYGRIGATVLTEREKLLDIIDDLRENSFDYYAALRSAYYQNRQSLINDQATGGGAGPAIPDYDDF